MKSSFATTINEKITLENGTSSQTTTEFRTTFNNYIDDLIKSKEEVKAETEKPVESAEKKDSESSINEIKSSLCTTSSVIIQL